MLNLGDRRGRTGYATALAASVLMLLLSATTRSPGQEDETRGRATYDKSGKYR